MKLTIEKLGRIDHAEIDIRPLTVFIGPNGTNKTWTAYVLYGLLRAIGRGPASASRVTYNAQTAHSPIILGQLKKSLQPLLDTLSQEPPPARVTTIVDIPPFIQESSGQSNRVIAGSIGRLLYLSPESLPSSSASLRQGREEVSDPLRSIEVVLDRPSNQLTLKIRRERREVEEQVLFTKGEWAEPAILDILNSNVRQTIGDVFVFPAERKGLLATQDLLANLSPEHGPLALVDFVSFLRMGRSMQAANDSAEATALLGMLSGIIGGEVIQQADDAGTRLVFRTTNGAILPLTGASSLVRNVAGLSIYLKRFFHPDDVLIIDELEMNAHPEAQLALTELMAALVNADVRVVLTTHSPYIVDHLNNLMEASKVPAEKQDELAQKFSLKTKRAFISPDKVAVHAFEDDGTGKVVVRETLDRESGLISWETFSRVTDKVGNLYGDILKLTPRDQ